MNLLQLFKNLFRHRLEISNLSLEEIQVLSLPRHPLWKKIRIEHLKKFPFCMVCGNIKKVVPHHIIPVHVDPSKELDLENLVSLCEGDTFNCHLFFGHFRNWTKYNPDVLKDALEWNRKVNSQTILV